MKMGTNFSIKYSVISLAAFVAFIQLIPTVSPFEISKIQIDTSFKFVLAVNPLPSRLQEYRLQKKFTDVTIRVGDEKYAAHRIVLEDSSPVLKRLLYKTSGKHNVFDLPREIIQSEIVEDLLTYFYTGELTITLENARGICIASSYLNISPLLSVCENFLGGRITPSNVLDLLLLSEKLKLVNLQRRCIDLISQSVSSINIPVVVSNKTSDHHFKPLNSSNSPICDCSSESAVVQPVVQPPLYSSCSQKPVIPSFSGSQIYIFGGNDGNTIQLASVSRFDVSTNKWHSVRRMKTARAYHSAAKFNKKVYIFGGKSNEEEYLSSSEVYDIATDTWALSKPMPEGRRGGSAATLNGYIYFAGGANSTHGELSSVLRYDPRQEEWKFMKSMIHRRDYFQLLAVEGRLYAIGDVGNGAVESYDPTTDKWSLVGSTQTSHYYSGATVHAGKIYVLSKSGFEMYDPDIDRWQGLSGLKDLNGRPLCSASGKLWALGGVSSGWYGTKSFFSYDFLNGNWTKEADMDAARSLSVAISV